MTGTSRITGDVLAQSFGPVQQATVLTIVIGYLPPEELPLVSVGSAQGRGPHRESIAD